MALFAVSPPADAATTILKAPSAMSTGTTIYLTDGTTAVIDVSGCVTVDVKSVSALLNSGFVHVVDLASYQVRGTLPVVNQGIGIVSLNQGDVLYASAADTLSALAKDASATRYLSNTGATNNPAWALVNVANGVTGTLPVANGGTARTTGTPVFRGDDASFNSVMVYSATATGGATLHVADASANITADASVNIAVQVPSGASVLGIQMRVETAMDVSSNWDASYNVGLTASIASNQSPSKDTKVAIMFNSYAASPITTGTTDVTIRKYGGGSFTAGGRIRALVYYWKFETMGNAP